MEASLSILLVYKLPPFGSPTTGPFASHPLLLGHYNTLKSTSYNLDVTKISSIILSNPPVRSLDAPVTIVEAEGGFMKIVYMSEPKGLCYVAVCSSAYPLRTAVKALRSLNTAMYVDVDGSSTKLGARCLTQNEGRDVEGKVKDEVGMDGSEGNERGRRRLRYV